MYEMVEARWVVFPASVFAPPLEEHDLAFPGIALELVLGIVAELGILIVGGNHRAVFLYEAEEIVDAIEGENEVENEVESDGAEILDD